MKIKNSVWLVLFLLFQSTVLLAQHHGTSRENTFDEVFWFGILELPFLFLCIYFSFRTAQALKGGIFGKGMNFLFWGFLVMAVGHIAMQVHHIFDFDVFRDVFGYMIGNFLWFTALMITWGLSMAGFISIYRASKQT